MKIANEDNKIAAEQAKALFDSFVNEGFTEEQAMDLVKTVIKESLRVQNRGDNNEF